MDPSRTQVVLDFRHESGVNSYLVTDKSSNELCWITQKSLPKDLDEAAAALRKQKGEFARIRVFGDDVVEDTHRKVALSKEGTDDVFDSSGPSSSDDSDSDSDASRTFKQSSAFTSAHGGHAATRPKVGLAKPDDFQSNMVSALASTIGCRSLRDLPHLFRREDDEKLNLIVVDLLYGTEGMRPGWHRDLIDLLWVVTLSMQSSANRDQTLESICVFITRICRGEQSMVSKSIDELLSEFTDITSSKDEVNNSTFSVFSSLCDLVIEARLKGLEAQIATSGESCLDTKMLSDGEFQERTRVQVKEFSYVQPGQRELDDDGIISLVHKIYQMRNRDKLSDVPGIVEKYRSQLSNLLATLLRKYDVAVADLGESRVFVLLEKKAEILKEKLTELFTVYEPSRLCDIDSIIAHFVPRPTAETGEYIAKLENGYYHVYNGESVRTEKSRDEAFGFRSLVREAIAVGNYDKLSQVDKLLSKYKGRENFLYLSICDKYGVPVDECRFRAADALRAAALEARRKASAVKILSEVYAKHSPSSVSEVSKLAEKHAVDELFEMVVKKFNIGLSEKISLVLDSDTLGADGEIDFTELFKETARGLAIAIELERLSAKTHGIGVIQTGTPSSFLHGIFNPVLRPGMHAAEIIIQGKSALFAAQGPSGSIPNGSALEELLRDQIEAKISSLVRKFSADPLEFKVTAQEPEYIHPDAFGATETGRVSCVVSLMSDQGTHLSDIVCALVDHLTNTSNLDSTLTGFRAHSILRSTADVTIFVGDHRSLSSVPAINKSPSLMRSRMAVFASVSEDSLNSLIKRCINWPRWLRQCSVVLDSHAHTVAVIGSAKHRNAYRQGLSFVCKILNTPAPYIAMRIPKWLCHSGRPASLLAPQIQEWSDATFHESADDIDTATEEPASETLRPLRLSRNTMRDAYLQGQLCMNCDETTHKPPECPIKRKVCWNCHGAHAGSACIYPCRFCKGKHTWGILECVKKGAKRFADWVKSRSYTEEKGLGALIDDVMTRLGSNGYNIADPAIASTVKNMSQMGVDFGLLIEQAKTDEGIGIAKFTIDETNLTQRIKPVPPSEPAPPLPDSKYQWVDRLWLDDLLGPSLMGRDAMRLIMSQRGQAIKQIEANENCKILFRGSSAKEIFTAAGSVDPAVDLRFHAHIMCETPWQAVSIKKALIDMISEIEVGINDGSIQKPPLVEGFAFLEKVDSLSNNLFQFDYLNINGGAPIEVDLKDHFEHIGDLRHWLHQKGIEVELGDDNSVRLPSASKVSAIIDKPLTSVDTSTVDVFNAFYELINYWTNSPPATGGQYWFEPFELDPVGLLGLTRGSSVFESGQVVKLSATGASHFAKLLLQCGYLDESAFPEEFVRSTISAFKGVVRLSAKDNRLLMYLRYPWALSSATGTVTRDVPEEFSEVEAFKSVLNEMELRCCGRLGRFDDTMELISTDPAIVKKQFQGDNIDISSLVPGECLLKRLSLDSPPETELPYVGYIVDWVTPSEITEFVSGMTVLPQEESLIFAEEEVVVAPPEVPEGEAMELDDAETESEEDLEVYSVAQLREMLKMKDLAITGRKADLIERLRADKRASAPEPKPTKSKKFQCRVELPRALMKWSEMVNNLTGPANSHFNHIKSQCPSATVVCLGSASAPLVGEARLHVQLTASDAADYKKAKSLVEDLVRAVAEVGAEICLADQTESARAAALSEVKVVGVHEP